MSHSFRWVVAVGCLFAAVSASHAYIFSDWDTNPNVLSTTLTTDIFLPGTYVDITKFWFVQSGTSAYFRMDLAGDPGSGATAPDYMLYINDRPGGDDPGAPGDYVSANAAEIDWIIDAHLDSVSGLINNHYHTYDAGNLNGHEFTITGLGGAGGTFLDSGTTFEWQVPLSLFAEPTFTVTAASFNIGTQLTWDTAELSPALIPEPASAILLLVGFLGFCRRNVTR